MQYIPLKNIPRQDFNITLDGINYEITLQAVQDCMYFSLSANGISVLKNTRCVAGYKLIPYYYMEGLGGNFTFNTNNDELPWWENFGSDQQLIYASFTDLQGVR